MRFIETFTGSFHSADTYHRARAARGFFMGYAALVVIICTLAVTLYFGGVIHREIFAARDGGTPVFDNVVRQIAQQIPLMTLKNGALISNSSEPTIIKVSATLFGQSFTDEAVITIDTSGASTHTNMQTPLLITSTELIIKGEKESRIQPLSKLTDQAPPTLLITRAVAMEAADSLIIAVHRSLAEFYIIFGIIAFLCFSIFMIVVRMLMLLALGLAGKIIATLTGNPLDYAAAVRLAAVSYTPLALLDTALFLGCNYAPHRLTLFLAGCVAIYAAIRASQASKPAY